MTSSDSAVAVIGAAALTHDFWMQMASWIPDIAQIAITSASLVFVCFRAANEIRKFWRSQAQERDSE